MKNTRKAAAVWLAMSLAISTAFGNTAWGEIHSDAGNNRCVHVHTAECYKDADKTATPSQIGKEPTECTHICSVESGCIRDTEKENNENADTLDAASNTGKVDSGKEQAGEKAADRKDSSGNADENKNLNDVPTQNGAALSVSTSSNAKDTTTTGGTVTQVSQTKILSWSWFDPEENLLDGRLELTGITEEAQPSFTEIIEYLPSAIIARVEEGKDGENVEDGEEKNLSITNWSCPEYVQDEEGRWPLEGTYEFKAELPAGYELAEGVDALVVEVSVVGDQAAVTATPSTYLVITQGKQSNYVTWDGSNLANARGNGWVATKVDDQGNFKLKLSNATLNQIYISGGNWTIELEGNNSLDGDASPKRGLYIYNWSSATIDGNENATLDVKVPSTIDSSAIYVSSDSKLTINRGIVKATIDYAGSDAGGSAAIYVSGTLNISGGKIITRGVGKCALKIAANPGGRFNMSGGTVEASGSRGSIIENGGTFELTGGTITSKSDTNGYGFVADGTSTVIGGKGELNTNILVVNTGRNMSIGADASATTNGVEIRRGGTLENNGHLVVDISLTGEGTFTNNGTISGKGTLPDGVRQDPGTVNVKHFTLKRNYSEEKIDVQSAADVTAPNQYVKLFYSIDESESTGIGTIDSGTGELTVKKAGIFKIKVKTLATGVYIEGTPAEITLTVNKADFPNDWNLTVNAVNKTYDGKKVAPATITSNIPKNVNASYQYQLAATSNANLLGDNWDSSLTVKNVADSYKYVFVRVVTDNYKSKIFGSSQPIEISRRTFNDVGVTITPDTVTYNGDNWEPTIKVTEDWSGAFGDEVDSRGYKIDWTNEEGRTVELKDAGTYTARLMGTREGNYSSEVKTASFTIKKCELKSQMEGGPLDKVYDGTTNITEEQNVFVKLFNDSGVPDFQDIHVDQVEYAYRSADVGEHYIDATIITLAGNKVKNYELINETSSLKGVIKPRDFASMTVSADPLTYNGTEKQPKINASVETGLENVSPDATFTYSKDGVNYQSEIPGFTEAGTYLVYVKASMANFNDETKTVVVTVQKAAAPTVSAMSESYSYKETGERQVALPGFPENCGTIGSITAQIVSDEGQILDSAAVDGMNLVLRLKGSSKNMVGKTAQVVVKVETKNYEDIQIPVIVTLTADSSDSNSNNNSGNNSGNNGSNNGNSNGSSGSDGDSSDYDDPNESSVKVTPNNPSNKVTKDSQKGYRNVEQGVITGTANQTVNDGYSHWMKDAKGWWLRFSDGTWPMADRTGAYHWEKINGRWWAFGADGYIRTGWIYDMIYQSWFYVDDNHGMLTGWQKIDGKWYYLNEVSDGTRGKLAKNTTTPDGYVVLEDGSWDGKQKK